MKVVVTVPNDNVFGEIFLSSPVSDLMQTGHPYPWPEFKTVRTLDDSRIAFGRSPESNEMFFEWLTVIQVGLGLIGAFDGYMTPSLPGQGRPAPDGIRERGDPIEISLGGEAEGFLVIWDQFLISGEREHAVSDSGFREIEAPLKTMTTTGGVSLLVPYGYGSDRRSWSDLSLADMSAPRISGQVGSGFGERLPLKRKRLPPISAETAASLYPPSRVWAGRGRPPKGFVVPKNPRANKMTPKTAYSPETDWVEPFLPIFRCGVPIPPPTAALDALANHVHVRVWSHNEEKMTASKIAHALSAAYRLGQDPERINVTKASKIHPNMQHFLKDRSRAITSLFPEMRPGAEMRGLIRVAALEAWWYGALPISWRDTPSPDRRFREELPYVLRTITPGKLVLLQEIAKGEREPAPSDLTWMAALKMIDFETETGLLEPWLSALRETVTAPSYDLPSLMDLLTPTKEAIAALEPSWVGKRPGKKVLSVARNPDVTSIEPLLEEAETLLSGEQIPTRDIMTLLARAWRLGSAPNGPVPSGDRTRLAPEARAYLSEGVSLIEDQVGSAQISLGRIKRLALVRDLVHDAWRSGFLLKPKQVPPARFLEGAPGGLRHLSAGGRRALVLLEDGNAPDEPPLEELVRSGLVTQDPPHKLTSEGVRAAKTERRHQSADLPRLADFVHADLMRKRVTRLAGSEDGYRLELDRIARSLSRNAGRLHLSDPENFRKRLTIALTAAFKVGRDGPVNARMLEVRRVTAAEVQRVIEEIETSGIGDDPADLEPIIRSACYRVSGADLTPETD